MKLASVAPRVRIDGAPIALAAANYSPTRLVVVFLGLAIALAVATVVVDSGATRVLTGAGAVMAVIALVVFPRFQNSVTEGVVSVDLSVAGLRFVAGRGIQVGFALMGVIGLAPGMIGLLILLDGGSVRQVLGPLAVGVLAIAWLGQQAFSLRVPPGLTLSEAGLHGVRGSRSADVPWQHLRRAEVVASHGAKLVLHTLAGSSIAIEPRWIGSDPNVVAAIIQHFLEHAEHRAALADPMNALAHVEAAD